MININALKNLLQSLVFVDCEAWGGCPRLGQLTEFGAVLFKNDKTFHGVIKRALQIQITPPYQGKQKRLMY